MAVQQNDIQSHMSGNSITDKVITYVGKASSWLCLALVLVQFAVVVARYVYDSGSVMFQEAILYIFGTMFMLALADTLQADRHVRVDMLYHMFPNQLRYKVDALGMLFFVLPVCIFLLWVSWGYVASSWAVFERSREATGLPGIFLFKSIILIALLLLLVQACAIAARCIRLLFS